MLLVSVFDMLLVCEKNNCQARYMPQKAFQFLFFDVSGLKNKVSIVTHYFADDYISNNKTMK